MEGSDGSWSQSSPGSLNQLTKAIGTPLWLHTDYLWDRRP